SRAEMLLIVVRQELSLIDRDIGLYRTLPFAALAGETQIESFLHGLTLPSVVNGFAADHLAQESCPPPGRMYFFARYHVARTHDAAARSAADAGSDASFGREDKIEPVVRIGKMRFWYRRIEMRP